MSLLHSELAKPEYAGLSDSAAAARLNERPIVGRRRVPLAEFVHRLFGDATWATLQAATTSAAQSAQVKAAAITVYDFLRNPHVEAIDMDLPATKGVLALLVQAGVLPQALVAEIDSLANVVGSRAEQLGLPMPLPVACITLARKTRR